VWRSVRHTPAPGSCVGRGRNALPSSARGALQASAGPVLYTCTCVQSNQKEKLKFFEDFL
jgi:hypothetical protein